VGIACLQLAKTAGLTVIATGGTDKGIELLHSEGAHHVLDHKSSDYLPKVKALTGDRGPDVILEMLANVNLANDLSVLAHGGRIVVIGSRGSIQIDPRQLMAKDAIVTGMMLRSAPQADLDTIHAALIAGLTSGALLPVVGKSFPLSEAAMAHRAILEPGAYGKIVLVTDH